MGRVIIPERLVQVLVVDPQYAIMPLHFLPTSEALLGFFAVLGYSCFERHKYLMQLTLKPDTLTEWLRCIPATYVISYITLT